jgi:hypothetical protein
LIVQAADGVEVSPQLGVLFREHFDHAVSDAHMSDAFEILAVLHAFGLV